MPEMLNPLKQREMRPLPILYVTVAAMLLGQGCTAPSPRDTAATSAGYLEGDSAADATAIGKEVTDSVGAVLKANLMKAMGEGGPVHAVEFCNTRAMPLTDAFNEQYGVVVKRTSDRLRNPDNAPNGLEAKVIADYRAEQAAGQMLLPKVALDGEGRKVFYAPIFTGAPCLICHGSEGNMDENLRSKLTELYPDDNAKGFNIDELRGVWSVVMVKGKRLKGRS